MGAICPARRVRSQSLKYAESGVNQGHMIPVPTNERPASLNSLDAHPGQPSHYRVLMLAPTSFFADYGCHVRILEEATVLQQLGHKVTIATYHNGNDVPGLDIRRTLPIPWRRNYLVGSSKHKVAFDVLLGLKTLELLAPRALRRDPCAPARRRTDRAGAGAALPCAGGVRFPGQPDR